ncbi:hypothetical protein HLBS07_32850 [Vibrio alginolyticus]|nr:hypothetical protein HLBS07_32850 [Vibrio alginolyticus]
MDGTEITETVELNIREGDSEIELTADLPNVTIDTEGSTQFASVVITEEQLLAQASDIDSDVLDIQNLELVGDNAEHATLTDNGDGTWTVTPDENFYGEIELGYQVTDGELTDDNIININFEAVNDAPIVSGPIVLSTDEDVGITFSADDLLANASDVEGDALSISDISYSGDNGELVDNGDGTYTFMPNENFNGEVDIDYKVFDGTDEVDTHLDLTVIPVNDVPVPGAPLHTQMLENGTIIIEAKDLLSGATDVDGDILHIENLLLVDQSQGTLTDNGDNTFTFEPTSNFYGEVNLTFDISDGQASAPSTAKIDVEIVNEGPEVSGPVDAVVDEDGSITITQEDLLANATDVDGDNLEAVNLSTNDPNATIVENADGSFTITPSENFFGEIEFTYDVTDAIETVAADLNLTVNPVNDLPDVPDLSFTTEDGEAITITEAELLAQATDIEGDDLSVVNVTSLSDTVQVTDNGDGTYTLTPEQGFFGNVDLTFDVSDGTDVVAANIDLKVEFVNDAPEAAPIVADVDEDGSILVTQEMLLENASDQDGDDLYATALESNDPNASIVDNGDGTFTVTPSQHFNGDIEFTYEVSDGELSVANEMTLTVNPVNDIPIVAPGMYHIEEDGSILFTQEDLLSGAIDIDGDDLTVTSINYSGDEGTVTDNGDGTFSFVPEEHFSGDLQFSFTVSDGTDEVEQDINVHIEAVADAPDLVITDGDGRNVDDQAILVEPGGIVEVNIAAALVDQDLSETLTVTVDGVPEGSVISYDNEGVLNDQDNGITSFNDTEITVTFEGETAGYQNTAGYYKVDEDGNITGVEVVYENASQVGGGGDLVPGQDQFSFQISEGESFNLFLIPNGHNFNDFASMQDGQYEFRAADGSPANMDTVDPQLVFVGADGSETVIQSQFGDAVFHGGSSSELNQDGIEHTRTTVNEDGELVYGFEDLYGGGDADYTDFNFTIDVGEVNSQIYSGEVTVGPDGSVTLPTTAIEQELQIQLPEDFNQQLEINVTATATELSNNDSETVSQTIYVNATGAHIEHAPEALPVSAMVEEDGSILITQEDLLANARDLDGDQLTALNLATDDENITITDNGDGTYTLTPDADFNGDITFTFDVSDGDDVVSTNLELLVSPVNDAPEPQDQAFTVGEDGVLTFTDADLLTGATDIEGDDLSVEGVTYTGADGVLTDNGDGTYSFAPNENFNGDVNFTFDVSDGTDTVTANIDVSVTPENDPPVAGSTAYTVHEDNSITISNEQLLANSSDIEGEVAIDSVSYSGNDGVLEINGDGTYTFSPNENFSGEVSLDVVVVDEDGATDSTTAGITVIEVNDPPIAGPTAYTIDEDQVLTFSESQVLLNASDVEGDVELVGISYDGPDGIFSVNGDGTCSFAPNENFNGQVQLDVTIRDEDGAEVDTYITVDVLPINDAPVSGNLAYSVDEDNSITLSQEQLLAQASDVEGDALTASNLVVDGDATVTANDDGSFTITPDANFNGDIDITFDINDGSDTIVATADLTVNPVNDLPQPEDQAFTIGEDGVLTFTDQDLLDGATDIDGDDLSVEGVTYTGADGVLTDNGDGTYSFAPNENFNGDVNFTFDVSDGTDTVTANIDVSVTPENDPPIAGSTSYTVHEDNSITISNEQLLANSSDVEGEVAIDSVSYSGADGVFQDNGDGTYTFSPNENFNGEVSLDVVVVDEDGATDSTTAGITVLEVNDPPIAGATSYSVNEDEVITISSEQLLANASDVEGEVAIDSVSYSGSDGIFTDNGDGTFSFAPNANFDGDVSLDVVVVDEDGATASTNANIDVLPINDAPVSGNLAYSVDEDNSITLSQEQLLAQASDVEGDALTATNLVVDGDATVTANDDGSFTITPDANFNGDIDITFDINDGTDAIVATADLTVNPVNDLPQPEDQAFTIGEDGVLLFTDEDLLDGATDIDGDNLSVEGVSYTGADGVLTDNGDGTYSFAPNENFNGDVNFTFDVSDGTDTVTANIDVSVTPENDPPVAGSTSYTVHEDNSITISDEQLLANSSDIEGDVSIDSVSYSGNDGVLEINGDGTYTFSPNENFNGEVSLDVVVVDEDGATDSTTAGITVLEVNDPPIAGPTAYTIDEDQVLTFSESQVLLNASDVEGDVELVSISYDGPDGIFSVNGDGTCSFAPNENFNGQVSLDVTIRDEDGAEVDTYITVDVLPINDAPVSGNLAYNVDEDNTITLSQEQLLSQASDVDGDDLVAENLLVDGNATVTANDDGSFTITPDANFNGDIDITFDISDGSDTLVATADLTVNPVNDLPQPEDQAFTIGEDGVLLFTDEDLLDGATDIDGDDLSVEGVSYTGADGVLTDNGDGTYSFAPNENFNGDVNFTFDVSDGTDTVTANIDVSVTPENDPPVAGSTSYTVHEDNSITISDEQLLANSSDIEGDVSVDSVSYSGADGVFQDNGDGTYTFSPNENFNGEVSLDVVVVDEDGATDSTTAGITVLEVNDPPIAGATSYSVNEDEVITISSEQLLANASDVEGDVAIDSVSYSGSDGIFTDNGDGTFSFAPNENFNGDVSLDVVVTDEDGATVATNANIDVLPINDAPVSGDLAYSVDEDGSITLSQEQLLAQAGDVDGDDLTAANLTVDGNATVVANDDGSFTITPDADFNGDIDLSFDITDGDATIQATADLTVNPVNDLPTVGQPQFVTQEDTSFTFTEEQLLQNAGDIDGDNLTVENVASDSGTLVDNGDGTYTFAPNENFDGNVNVTFDVNDGTATVPAEANIDVQSVVDMPELSIASDLVIASDNFESGSNGWNANTESSQGFETGNMLGRIGGTGGDEAVSKTYEIPSDVNEVNISFSFYEIDSWDGESFQIFVGGEQLTTLENSAFRTQDGTTTLYDSDGNEVGEVIHGASQREGFSGWNDQAHQINLTVPVEDGELQLGFGSTLNQDVWDESFGIDNIEITVADADYQIIGTEDTPVPLDIDAALTDTDGSENLSILIEDVPEGSALSAGVDNGDGTWSLQPGELEGLEFIPSADFNGDVTLTVNATSTDVDTGTTATATQDVTIHISPTNDAPEVTGDITAVTAEDNSITLTQEQLLEHAVDIDGDDLSAINLSTNDENATVEMNEDGSFTITPSENFYGDIEFSYDVTDGEEVVAVGLDLTVTPVNDAPEPQDQAFTVGEDGILTFTDADLLTGATDVEGDNLTVEGVTYTGADGVLTDNGDGTYSFAPNENFNGDVNFTFDVSDGTDTVTANIDVTVTPENDPPVAGSTSYTVHEDNSITISDEQLLANSSDIEGDVDISSVTYSGNDGVFQDNGDGTYTFSPNENFNGEVSLDVVVVDEEGATDSTTAGITVLEVNDPPISGATSYSVNEDEVIIFTEEQLLAQSSDVEGDVSLESVSYSGSDGILTANDDGTYSFAPNENFNGGVSLDVVVADEDGATATTNANIDVLPVNDAPVSGDLAYSVDEDGSITLSQEQLLAQAGDVDSDNLEAVNLTAVANATVVENQDGSFTITPDANFNGDIDLSFDLIDNDGASVEVGVDLTVNPINDAPQSTPVNIAGTEDTTILITQDMLLANATDIDNTYDELSAVDLVIDEQYGDLLDNGDGTWSFTPAENFNGDVPMSFGVSDGDLVTPVEGNLNIEAVNDAPEAPTIQMQGEEDVVMVIDPAYIADQVTDLDGDEISVESITVRAPANATLTQQPDGMYHLVTTQDFNGLVELGYTATDGEEVVEGSLNVDVIPVNDAPFNVGNAFMATDEDGAFTFDAGDLMNLFGDIDTENLVVSRIITAEGEDGGEVTDNGDGTWTFTPTGDFAGVSDLQVVVSDGEFETVLDVPVFVRPVADGAVITTDHDGPLVFGEDETGHLGLNVGLIDDSETLSNLVMTGFPVGFEVTDGVNTITITEPGQYIDLNEWDISDLQMTPPADFNGEFFVTVTATTVDYGDEPEEFEDGIDSGDFETLAGEPVILTADDLIGLAENVDADAGDEVKFVHLADRSQGEIVDNGDGTWTFNPAPGFTGEADIAYVIDKDGVLHDEQTGVVVKEDAPQENASPEIDSISTTEMAADGTLSFTNDDMLSTLSDAEGDSLSIESVSLMEGQGVIETDNQGNYQFTPAEGYTGDVQVGFIATDGENRIESFFNIDIQGEGETTTSEGYALADDGSLTLTEAQLIDELGISPSAEVLDVADANDAGFFAKSGDEEWTYWPNDDFDGNLAMDVQVNDNGEVSTQNLSIQVADDSAQSDEPQIQTAQASSEQQVGEAQQPEEQAANGADSEEESAADVTAAPGDTISISVPDEVSGNESVDYAEMSGLPDGASVSNALDNGDGSFTLSGNLNQPVSVDLPEGYEGTSEIQFQGYDELGSAVEGASGTVEVEVDDQYTMQGSAQDQQPDMAGMESGGSDWTSAGGQDQGVDFTDDSGSFDSDTQTGTDQGNDFDQSSM